MSPDDLARQAELDHYVTRKIDIVAVYNLIRTLVIIVLVCTVAVCAGMVGLWRYSSNTRDDVGVTRQDARVTKDVACNTAELIHGRAPEYVIPKECP